VYGVAWSRDGRRLATASADRTAKVWDARTGQELFTLRGHRDEVGTVAWGHDDQSLATGSDDQTARVWDTSRGKELLTIEGWESVAWSPDGTLLTAASGDGVVKIRNSVSGEEKLELRGHTDRIENVAWSPDGRRLATISRDQMAKVWDAGTGKELVTFGGFMCCNTHLAWSPDSNRLLTAGGGWANLVDAANGQQLLTFKGHDESVGVGGLAWSPDGKRVAAIYNDAVMVWDPLTARELLSITGNVGTAVAWDPPTRAAICRTRPYSGSDSRRKACCCQTQSSRLQRSWNHTPRASTKSIVKVKCKPMEVLCLANPRHSPLGFTAWRPTPAEKFLCQVARNFS
jgi:WD40 repeat protein